MKCHVQGCKRKVVGALRMPTDDGKSSELWYYCKDHYKMAGVVNELIDSYIANIPKLLREFRKFSNPKK